ncbi:MAG: RsmE family RNA methyltransferase [Patescibacteria group bacterium]|nr:RsmE family RNA methyltransferase [Patescibacteria group bacterium]
MADRYFAETPIPFQPGTELRVTLSGGEAHHLIHVMRATVGTRVTLFDGGGAEFPAEVGRMGRAEVELAVLQCDQISRELPRHVALAVALPKGDRQRWLVEKAVELGVAELIPLATQRSVAQPVSQALDRLRRAVIEASKQCGRNRLMHVAEPADWPALMAATRAEPQRWLAHPGVQGEAAACVTPRPGDRVFMAVGPEGGFTDEEVALAAAARWQPIHLGARILRTETAALAMAVLAAQ